MTKAAFVHGQRRARIFLGLTSLLALGFAACRSAEKEKEPVVSVEVTPAEKTSLSQIVVAEAVVFPLKQATVSPKITSAIADFKVQRGSRVTKGQLLAVLENKDLAAQAEASKGDFEQADANYVIAVNSGLPQQLQKAELDAASAKSAFDAAQKVYDSRKDLYQQGAIPRRDLDAAEVALAQARSLNEQAQKQLADLRRLGKEQLTKAAQGTKQSAEGRYRAAAAQLSYSEIRSPIDGIVTDRPLYPGEMPNSGVPLITVMDLSRVTARAHLPQRDAASLKVGDPATIEVPGLDKPTEGKVTLVSPALDPNSTTIEVWVQARNPGGTLKPGSSVRLSMVSQTVRDALVVPASAVLTGADGSTTVMVIGSDQHAHQSAVKIGIKQIGIKQDENMQILEGLKEGQSIVATGAYGLPDNSKVAVETANEKEVEKAGDKPTPGEAAASSDTSKEEKQ